MIISNQEICNSILKIMLYMSKKFHRISACVCAGFLNNLMQTSFVHIEFK